eukprot:c6039_g1_i1.p1 GENE.c6039_g1_i1~~c6039_g1_i1.p1  ORF type:complete len:351 (+),score=93.45 c6039_g1_i1:51-1055(+)
MGGQALKNVIVRRYLRQEYFETWNNKVKPLLSQITSFEKFDLITAYHNKESFGDMDVMVQLSEEASKNPKIWIEEAIAVLKPLEYTVSQQISAHVDDLQLDLIPAPHECFDFAFNLMSYNDLGAFIGHVARPYSLSLTTAGLFYKIELSDHFTHKVLITRDFPKALTILGYDPIEHSRGFATPQQLFEYTTSSDLFCSESLELRNTVRKNPRMLVVRMLEYLELHPNLRKSLPDINIIHRISQYCPEFEKNLQEEIESTNRAQERHNARHELFNGILVQEWIGGQTLNQKLFGTFMKALKNDAELTELLDRPQLPLREEVERLVKKKWTEFQLN